MMASGLKRTLAMLFLVMGLAACGVEPWVKPYERANLADPIMSSDRLPSGTAFREHVYEVREGARGASSGGGGGCGCN